jgi:small subunit ribosomal protein S5
VSNFKEKNTSNLVDKLVSINRVSKVVKGGRNFSFASLVVVGDGQGRVGHGLGKAREVPDAIRKANEAAEKNMIRVPLKEGRTFHHDVVGTYGAAKLNLRAAPPGTGIIAGGPARAVLEALGVRDVVCKSVGTSNPHNMVRALFNGLLSMASPRMIAQRRGMKVSDIVSTRRAEDSEKSQAGENSEPTEVQA